MYMYGMKERGFGMGCQPKGFVKWEDSDCDGYYSYVYYDEPLTEEQMEQYEMELISEDISLSTRVREVVEDMDEVDLVWIWNRYCDKVNYVDDIIEPMTLLDDFMYGMTATEIFEKLRENDFDINEEWFKVDMWGYESTDDVSDWIDTDEMIDYIVDHEDWLENYELKEVFLSY